MARKIAQPTREELYEQYLRLLLEWRTELTPEGCAQELFTSLRDYRLHPPGFAGNETEETRGGIFTRVVIQCAERQLLTDHGGPAAPLVRYNQAQQE